MKVWYSTSVMRLLSHILYSKTRAGDESKIVPKMNPDKTQEWLDSKAARKVLKISACDLSHLREAGKLQFQKRGNAYLYSVRDVKNMSSAKRSGEAS